jgi:DNA-binding NarL/FixJ family response regulator
VRNSAHPRETSSPPFAWPDGNAIGPYDESVKQRIRVVLVDDHELMRRGTRSLLEGSDDITVIGEASDGATGVDVLVSMQPDVALVDIAMPGLNGIEVTRQVKAQAPEVAVLVLTVHDEEVYVRAILEAGAAGYLLKDVSGSVLIDSIRAVASGDAVMDPAITSALFRSMVAGEGAVDGSEHVLTPRELDVLRVASTGISNRQIADALEMSPRTVQSHLRHIFEKFDVASRTEAVIKGLRLGLVSLEDLA